MNISLSNTGNMRINAINLTSTTWANFDCGSGTGIITLLNPGAITYCTANYTLDQTAYEAAASGSMSTTITAASASLTASSGQVEATVNIPTAYTASVVVSIDSCTLPTSPGECGSEPSSVGLLSSGLATSVTVLHWLCFLIHQSMQDMWRTCCRKVAIFLMRFGKLQQMNSDALSSAQL